LSGFSMAALPGCSLAPAVDGDAKIQALTVPRFRKDAPPLHALVAGNGDVLRGEIEAATASHFAFRSGLESLRVPRERVVAAVFLKKPGLGAPLPEKKSRAQQLLDQMIENRMGYGGADLNMLVEAVQREVPDLKFKLPEPRIERRVQIQLGAQTAREALDQICALFDLRFRVDAADDTVVIEAAAQSVPPAMVQKVYWLKSGAFADGAAIAGALDAKGVPFPPGADAIWNAEVGQLVVTNTRENQQKLLEVLGTDFGGSLGTPTHWLMLANGARIGLAVEKFEKESVTGTHPVYGRCRVAMADICAVRNVPPEATETMTALTNWRLINAPEPVLPEAGPDGSPLLGKDAAAFKIPLLEGGDFDLKKEKGKIVVLDFWATWCGPCVRSLPELIEAVAAFPADRVRMIGVNEGEPAEPVKRFIEARRWKLTVAMDAAQSVGKSYGADAIPRTVVIGQDGKVAFVKDGYSAEGGKEVADAVKKLLEAPGR
jgi:thiol-disulfide isomerase/thioredoxin